MRYFSQEGFKELTILRDLNFIPFGDVRLPAVVVVLFMGIGNFPQFMYSNLLGFPINSQVML